MGKNYREPDPALHEQGHSSIVSALSLVNFPALGLFKQKLEIFSPMDNSAAILSFVGETRQTLQIFLNLRFNYC